MWGATPAWSGPPARASMTLDSDCGQNDRRSSTTAVPQRHSWGTGSGCLSCEDEV